MPEQPPDPPSPELVAEWGHAVARIEAVQQLVRADIARSGVPAQWFEVLRLLSAAPEGRMPMSAIARGLAITSGGFTKLADRMAREGLIDRRSASVDRRVVYATLTERGRELAATVEQVYVQSVDSHVLGAIDADELRTLAGIAERLDSGRTGDDDPLVADEQFELKTRLPAAPERRSREPAVTVGDGRPRESGGSAPRT